MASSNLQSRHQRYKEDTNVFTTWLSTAAKKCGYKIKAEEVKSDASKHAHNHGQSHSHVPAKAPKLKVACHAQTGTYEASADLLL